MDHFAGKFCKQIFTMFSSFIEKLNLLYRDNVSFIFSTLSDVHDNHSIFCWETEPLCKDKTIQLFQQQKKKPFYERTL